MILYNGSIYTMDEKGLVQAVKINADKIVKAGTNAEILSLKEDGEEIIDLAQKTVLPGFNDSHLHLYGFGKNLDTVNLHEATSITEIIDKGKQFIEERSIKENTWVLGRGWNQDYFITNKKYPTKTDLDKISTKHPIIFTRVCGHIAIVNSRALEICEIDETTPQIPGGEFDYKLGLFKETAINLITDKMPKQSVAEIKEALIKAMRYANSKGITSVQTDDLSHAGSFHDVLQAYEELRRENQLTCRIYEQCLLTKDELTEFLNMGYKTGTGDEYFKIGPLKILSDGSLGARTAAVRAPYADDSLTSGVLCFSQEELDDIILYAQNSGMQLAVHCIGDRALETVIRSFEKAHDGNDYRHGIVHCQITDTLLLEKMRQLSLIAYIQPIFLNYDLHIVEARVGKALAKTSYAFKTMLDKGIPVALGTDCPVEAIDPLPNIYCAVTRADLNGFPEGGWNPEERLSVTEAVLNYTRGSAYASFEENIKGTVTPGKLADLVVLDKDIFQLPDTHIKEINVLMTIVGGKIVYKNN